MALTPRCNGRVIRLLRRCGDPMAFDSVALAQPTPGRRLLFLIVPALVVGTPSALTLLTEQLQEGASRRALHPPVLLAVDDRDAHRDRPRPRLAARTVGARPRGPDPATTGLVDPPLPPDVVPGLLVVTVPGGEGQSGDREPDHRRQQRARLPAGPPGRPGQYGRPLDRARRGRDDRRPLRHPGRRGADPHRVAHRGRGEPGALWDRLFAPLAAGVAGALTMTLPAHPGFALSLPPYPGADWADLLSSSVIASAGAALGLAAVYAAPYTHRAFRALRHPVLMPTAGGLLLGLLGALGGHVTLFKGLDEVKELSPDPSGRPGSSPPWPW